MDKFTLKHYKNKFWDIADLFKNDLLIAKINKFYEVTEDWIFIFETEGGSGTGFYKGEVVRKIYIGDSEFEKIEVKD